jgi:streptogramin lyase
VKASNGAAFPIIFRVILALTLSVELLLEIVLTTSAAGVDPRTFTLDADFDRGTLVNLNHDAPNGDQLQLNGISGEPGFIWVSVSTTGTVLKIDASTGAILGEYATAPEGEQKEPSQLAVSPDGSVWGTNYAGNSVVHIGIEENDQCVDRDRNGAIETSTGHRDILDWPNSDLSDGNGPVYSAQDECILHYVRVDSSDTRQVSVTANGDVWVGGTGNTVFQLIDGETGAILRTEGPVGIGGYDGLVDGSGVLWSSSQGSILRWDTSLPLSGPAGGNWSRLDEVDNYGHELCVDGQGTVWSTSFGGSKILKYSPSGDHIGSYSQGSAYAQGCVVDENDHAWVAHSINGYSVGHLRNDGSYVGKVDVGNGPISVAMDAAGRIWVANHNGGTLSRIDPSGGPLGFDGVTNVGRVAFESANLGIADEEFYYYLLSDIAGPASIAPPSTGTWTVIHDSGAADTPWSRVSWNAETPADASLVVRVASSADGSTFGPETAAVNGEHLSLPPGRYLRVSVALNRATIGGSPAPSPVLKDLTVISNRAPTVVVGPESGYAGEEGSPVGLTATAADEDGDLLTYAWSYIAGSGVKAGAACSFGDATKLNTTITCTDDGEYQLTLQVSDGIDSVTDTTSLLVSNVKPTITTPISSPTEGQLLAIGTSALIDSSFVDPGSEDVHDCAISWNDGSAPTAGTVDQTANTCSAGKAFPSAGVYTVAIIVSDDGGGVSAPTTLMVVVYDPSAGFVTGGGSIDSPIGAYRSDPTLTGKATFGFVAKYQKGATVPVGQTEFRFQAGGFNFHSTSYQWFVVAGAKAQFKGVGTVNGQGEYAFLLTATDGQVAGGGGVDKLRIKVWEKASGTVVYDNAPSLSDDIDAVDPQAISRGSIVIHQGR